MQTQPARSYSVMTFRRSLIVPGAYSMHTMYFRSTDISRDVAIRRVMSVVSAMNEHCTQVIGPKASIAFTPKESASLLPS
jgi:hypothetical protein